MVMGLDLLSLLPNALQPQTEGAPAEPPPPGAPVTQPQSPWGAYLSNPANRAMMITTGLQMMTGGWGSPMQNAAYAIGRGMEAQSGTEMLQYEQGEKDREAARKSSEAAAGRQTQLDVAGMNTASREEIARARNEGLMQRELVRQSGKQGAGPKTPAEQKLWDKLYEKAVEANRIGLGSGNPKADADKALEDRRATFGGAEGEGTEKPKPATGTGTGTTSTAPAAAKPPDKSYSEIQADWKELQSKPSFAAAMKDPALVEELIQKKPWLASYIRAARGRQAASDMMNSLIEKLRGPMPKGANIPEGTP